MTGSSSSGPTGDGNGSKWRSARGGATDSAGGAPSEDDLQTMVAEAVKMEDVQVEAEAVDMEDVQVEEASVKQGQAGGGYEPEVGTDSEAIDAFKAAQGQPGSPPKNVSGARYNTCLDLNKIQGVDGVANEDVSLGG